MHPNDSVFMPLHRKDGEICAYMLVDRDDLPLLSSYHWIVGKGGYGLSKVLSAKTGVRTDNLYAHRLIAKLDKADSQEADHRNRNGFDNRRSNLRVITHAENCQNLSPRLSQERLTSKYRGVRHRQGRKKNPWTGRVYVEGKIVFYKDFPTEEEAHQAVIHARRIYLPFSTEEP